MPHRISKKNDEQGEMDWGGPFNLFGLQAAALYPWKFQVDRHKIDSPCAFILPMVRQWLINAGCERIFMVNNESERELMS